MDQVTGAAAIEADQLSSLLQRRPLGPILLDVRREPAFVAADASLPGALRRPPEALEAWAPAIEPMRAVVAFCVHGHAVSQGVAAALAGRGVPARYLAGGIEGWRSAGLPLAPKPMPPSLWVTRERPKIDRIACPWLIRRFIDPDARFLYVPPGEVLAVAERTGALPFDVPGVGLTHRGEGCSFDALLEDHGLAGDPVLRRLALIVRGADTERPDLAPEAAGLLALSLGLSALGDLVGPEGGPDDQATLRHGFLLYDALYAWARDRSDERHAWPPAMPLSAGAGA